VKARLNKVFDEKISPEVQREHGISNKYAVPRLEKVIVNMGVGKAIGDIKILENAMQDLAAITGQKPVMTRAKISVSNFKLREGMPIGCKVTLRRRQMYEFIDRLFNVSLPRIRDFNGISFKSFDRQGNFSMGLKEQSVFPEIDTGRIKFTQGMDITFVFRNGNRELNYKILKDLGMPFRKKTA
jgi:large subunit ribosomal protein L5